VQQLRDDAHLDAPEPSAGEVEPHRRVEELGHR
jgi:hypothetical protein